MTYTPAPKVEIAFGFGPYDPEPLAMDWVDVTDHVLEVNIERGRNSEFAEFPASTASILLLNDERQFDPLNTAGDYYGLLVANTPVRVTATIGVTSYPVWRGFVDGWPAEYTEGGFRSEVEVQCTDAFKLLAERPFPDTWLSFLDDFGGPVGYYPMDGSGIEGVANAAPVTTRKGRTINYTSTASTVDPLSPVSIKAVQLPSLTAPNAQFYWGAQAPIVNNGLDNPVATTAWSISFLMRSSGRGFQGLVDVVTQDFNTFPLILVQSDISGGLNTPLFVINGSGGNLTGTGAEDIGDGQVHHIVVTRNTILGSMYVDGHLSASEVDGTASGVIDATNGRVMLGRSVLGPNTSAGVVIDELMWWDRVLSAAEVAELHDELTTGYADVQTSGSAIDAILDEVDWPATLRNLDDGEVLVNLPARPTGAGTLGLLQNVARCEAGRLFVDRAGKVTFHDRGRPARETVEHTVQYEFTDIDRDDPDPPDVGLLDGTLSITVDDRLTFDAAEVTRAGGTVQASRLSTTPARTYAASGLLLTDDRAALSRAQWTTFRYGTAQPRSESWEVDGEVRPADWADLLSLEIGHRIRHTLTPGGVGSSLELDQHVAYIGHSITPEQWVITLNGTPTDPNEAAYFVWDTTETSDPDNGWGDTDGTPPGGYWS